jgi:hypothetical protein
VQRRRKIDGKMATIECYSAVALRYGGRLHAVALFREVKLAIGNLCWKAG